MRGLALFLLVIIAADAVRSQGSPTRTKKGRRPSRRGDNTDRGLPSGKDVPDGRRYRAPAAVPPSKPAAGGAPVPPPVVPPKPVSRTRAGPPPPYRKPAARPVPAAPKPPRRSYGPPPPNRRPAGRRGDNTDRGLPSGADVPDNRARTRSGPPPSYRVFPVVPQPPVNAYVPPPVPMNAYVPPPVPMNAYVPPPVPVNAYVPPVVPTYTCADWCGPDNKAVCSVSGKQYNNDCLLQCAGEMRECENPCPCYGAPPVDPMYVPAAPVGSCEAQCGNEKDLVCVDGEEVFFSECHAICAGKNQYCGGTCPCTK